MARIVQFATFQADLEAGELYKDGIKLKLGGQPFQVLAYLLGRPGQVVTRDELQSELWQSDTFVDFDAGLNTAINKIREALGDSAANPRFVETVPRRGYRFIAPVEREEKPTPPVVPVVDTVAVPEVARKFPYRWVAGIGVVALLGAGLWAFRPSKPESPIQYKLTQVTRDDGLTHQPSISADGNFVVYASDRATGKDMDIWMQHVSGGEPVRLTSSPADESYPSISADGRKVAFETGREDLANSIYMVPALGGTPKLLAPIGLNPQIAPDGSSVAYFVGGYLTASELYVVSTEGGAPRKVENSLTWARSPLWMPDSKSLLAWGEVERGKNTSDYYELPAAGGVARKTGIAGRLSVSGVTSMAILRVGTDPFPAAAAASDGVVAVARDSDNQDLWWVPLEGGPPVRITAGAGAAHPSVAGTGRIAFARRDVKSGLWRLPVDANTGRTTGELQRMGRQIASMNYPNLSRDGKMLVYVSNRSGSPDVWVRNLETGEDRQLTSNKADEFRASISPDGQQVAYTVNRDVVTLPVKGGVEKVICRACAPNVMMWSPDGKKLLVYWGRPIRHGTIDLATGKQEELVVHPTGNIHNGRYSPDGKWIMFTLVEEAARVIYVTSVENGKKPEAWIRLSGESVARSSFWSPDGNLVYIHQIGVLMARRLDAASKTPVGEAFVVQRLGPAFSPLFSANGMSTDSLYFLALETSSNIWIADPIGR